MAAQQAMARCHLSAMRSAALKLPLTPATASVLCRTIWPPHPASPRRWVHSLRQRPRFAPAISGPSPRPHSSHTIPSPGSPPYLRALRNLRVISVYVLKLFAFIHLVHSLVFEVRDCAGASMLPTLSLEGDVLLQLRLPLLRTWDRLRASIAGDTSSSSSYSGPRKKQPSAAPGDLLSIFETGDIVVALSPFDPTRVVCKRLIGLPGDTILVEPRLGLRPTAGGGRKKRWKPSEELEEDDLRRIKESWSHHASFGLDGLGELEEVGTERESDTADGKRRTDADEKAPLLLHRPSYVTVPPGHVWLCGDNMGNSSDSRDYGPVPLGLLRGKIVARIFPSPMWLRGAMTEA